MQEAQLLGPWDPSSCLGWAPALTLGRCQARPTASLGIGSPTWTSLGRARRGPGFGGFAWLSWVCPAQGRTGPVTMGTATEPWAEEETLRAMARLLTCASKLQPAQVTHAGDTCY